MVMAVRLAGFEIRDMIAWLYGSGFPKSLDISKAIDKHLGAEREVIGTKMSGIANKNEKKRYTIGASKAVEVDITAPSTEEAKQWQGWGTALKPALEPIVMARKPLIGTVAQNVLKHGVGGINIDESRIETDEKTQRENKGVEWGNRKNEYYEDREPKIFGSSLGRFPANVIHDGSDEVVSLFPESSVTGIRSKESLNNCINNRKERKGKTQCDTGGNITKITEYGGDSGSAARFFYTAKASKEERNFGLYDFEEKEVRGGGGRVKQGYDTNDDEEKRLHIASGKYGAVKAKKKNIHPTVKPIDLMRYLVRLVTPPNGICLDPYLGSGTTAIACEMEKFRWIGIELMPEYAEIAKARISAVKDYEATLDTKTIIKESIKEDKEKELGIQNIFDFIGEEK
jgi:site-specific DNA-methyltransferase (adenine-specific)